MDARLAIPLTLARPSRSGDAADHPSRSVNVLALRKRPAPCRGGGYTALLQIASSLTNRIFLACALLALLSLGFAFYFVNARATSEAETALEEELTSAADQVSQQGVERTDRFIEMARIVADAPKLKAAVETDDPPTVQQFAGDYLKPLKADLFTVTDPHGHLLAAGGVRDASLVDEGAASLEEFSRILPHARGLLQIVNVPIYLDGNPPHVLGRLTVGFFLDDALARQFRASTGTDIAFGVDGRVLASSLPRTADDDLAATLDATGIARIMVNDEEFLALARPVVAAVGTPHPAARGVVLTLRSRTARLRFLTTVRNGLVGALILTVLLATLLSYAVARTVTRPLAAVTSAMREVAITGDLTRKVAVRTRAWDDEDARLLASTFNTLTESIARFQQLAAEKDRLTSLGRLSTVIAHEIRNPLMIISATLSTLRRDLPEAEFREAINDIDGETWRLNRIVSDVLDFARPLKFDLAETDLNEVCRDSVSAAWAGAPREDVQVVLAAALPPLRTDAERLRTALVNIMTNARHAVEAVPHQGREGAVALAPRPAVTVTTGRAGDRVTITIRDAGIGIAPEDMAHIFDPYFTTRRTGTGLGLPISKNILEGLGGRLSVHSTRGEGTEISISLPVAGPDATA